MRSVSISRQKSATCRQGNYRVDLTINTANNITPYLFVKQRIIRPDGSVDEQFAAVASPMQIEEIAQQAPDNSSYFRDDKVSLVSSDSDYLAQIVNDILADIQLTIIQLDELDVLNPAENITVTNDAIVVDS